MTVALVVIAIMWPLSLLGHAIGLTPSWHQLMNRNHVWEHQHYPLVGLRYLATAAIAACVLGSGLAFLMKRSTEGQAERARIAAQQATAQARHDAALRAERVLLAEEQAVERQRQAEAARQAWLAAPPPPLAFPGRFTQTWIQNHVPGLHPGQIQPLLAEMSRRGWTDDDVKSRVAPYFLAHRD